MTVEGRDPDPIRDRRADARRGAPAARARATARGRSSTRDELYDRLHARLRESAAAADARSNATSSRRRRRATAAREADRRCRFGCGRVSSPRCCASTISCAGSRSRSNRFEELIDEALGRRRASTAAPSACGADAVSGRHVSRVRAPRARVRRLRRARAARAPDRRSRRPIRFATSSSPWPTGLPIPTGLFVRRLRSARAHRRVSRRSTSCATEAVLGSGFHERLHNWWPGLEEVRRRRRRRRTAAATLDRCSSRRRTRRRRAVVDAARSRRGARRRRAPDQSAMQRAAKQCRSTARRSSSSGRCRISTSPPKSSARPASRIRRSTRCRWPPSRPSRRSISCSTRWPRTSRASTLVALLRSPHFVFDDATARRHARIDRARSIARLSDARYLGELERLEALAADWRARASAGAAGGARGRARAARRWPSRGPRRQQHRACCASSGASRSRPLDDGDPFAPRERRARAAVRRPARRRSRRRTPRTTIPQWTIDELARRRAALDRGADVRAATTVDGGRAAARRSGRPLRRLRRRHDRRPRRERLARAAAPEHLLSAGAAQGARLAVGKGSPRGGRRAVSRSARRRRRAERVVSTFTLDDEALVVAVDAARRDPARAAVDGGSARPIDDARVFVDEALSLEPLALDPLDGDARGWAELRVAPVAGRRAGRSTAPSARRAARAPGRSARSKPISTARSSSSRSTSSSSKRSPTTKR